jgi:uncharacterized protein DUF6644
MTSIFPFFRWANDTSAAHWIANSSWGFPALEGVHIVALALLFGAVIFVDLQMLGVIRSDTPVWRLDESLRPWIFTSLVIILVTGVLLFLSEATKLYNNGPFRIKVVMLLIALVFHFTIHREATQTDRTVGLKWERLTAAVSLVLWISVGLAGRAIGFF